MVRSGAVFSSNAQTPRVVKIAALLALFAISSASPIQVCADVWRQTTWFGGSGQEQWADSTMYSEGLHVDGFPIPGDLLIDYPAWAITGELVGATYVQSLTEGFDRALYAGGTDFPEAKVYRSTDWGASWDTTGSLMWAEDVFALLQASDSALYAGTGGDCDVFKSTDWGGTWWNTGEIMAGGEVSDLIEASDGAIYAATHPGNVFKTTNGGVSWDSTGKLADGFFAVYTILEASDGALFAGTGFGDPKSVFKSTDAGSTWVEVWSSHWGSVASVIEDVAGFLYAGTAAGFVFRSTDAGTTWVETGAIEPRWSVNTLICASDGAIYAGTFGYIFESTDAGDTWLPTGPIPANISVWSFLQPSDGHIYFGMANSVFRSCYFDYGNLISSIFDTGNWGTSYGIMDWEESLSGQSLVMKVRTSPDSMMANAMPWFDVPPALHGQDISSLPSVNDGDRYVQYRAELLTWNPDVTPSLQEVSISFAPVGIQEEQHVGVSGSHVLSLGNYPSPFLRSTTIRYEVPQEGHVALHIYDLTGRLVKTLVDAQQTAGIHYITWEGEDDAQVEVPNGVFFIVLSSRSSAYESAVTGKVLKCGRK